MWCMSASPLFLGPTPSWLTGHLDDLSKFCSTSPDRTIVVDAMPTTRDDGRDLIEALRDRADVVALLVKTDDQPVLQEVIVAGFEPFARVSTRDEDRFLFFATTRRIPYAWPSIDDVQADPAAA